MYMHTSLDEWRNKSLEFKMEQRIYNYNDNLHTTKIQSSN